MVSTGLVKAAACAALVLLLTACGGGPRHLPPKPDPAVYGQATGNDPWGPYIRAASDRFDVPEAWVRTVMEIESGGRTTLNGRPITSHAGAMGLMQVMPATFAELSAKYDLGDDPYEPWANILAGTAYLREMYDRFGSPGLFAAYNCGPGCYSEYLAGRRRLPRETRNYMAKASTLMERNGRQTMIASAPAPAPNRRAAPAPAPIAVAAAVPTPPVPTAARTPATVASGRWGIQVGAFSSAEVSSLAAAQTRQLMMDVLGHSQILVTEVATSSGTLYRARLVGISQAQADRACERLIAQGGSCMRVAAG